MAGLLEKDLRQWLRVCWNNGKACAPLSWIEPTTGSSIGFPDVLIPLHPLLLPVELKLAKQTKNGKFVSTVRPVQRRFHLTMRAHNYFSAFLVAYGERNKFDVYLTHNSFSFFDHNEKPGELLVARNQNSTNTITKQELLDALKELMNIHNQRVGVERK